ncbi:MAG: [FeFe] hydrogenase H-cluster radical SAM maturase HydE [Phycisphaerales bacterium JB038]
MEADHNISNRAGSLDRGSGTLNRETLEGWLRETDEARLEELRAAADAERRRRVGEAVHLRGLIEISNHCERHCLYCGVRAPRREVSRYRLNSEEILACARRAGQLGFGTIVMQAGEDPGLCLEDLARTIERIKVETACAVTLSLGELSRGELARLRQAGADRYLLRFETSDRDLFQRIHPPSRRHEHRDRLEILAWLRELGYEVGSGVMIGIPGQSYSSLAQDIELFHTLDLDMIGVGPYLAHLDTPLGRDGQRLSLDPSRQAPVCVRLARTVVALARLVQPNANIPSTTALATLDRAGGHRESLRWGANVVMPNLTPPRYRAEYEIYPDKAGIDPVGVDSAGGIVATINSIGRTVARGRGDSPNITRRRESAPKPLQTEVSQ